jgi:DNA-3-methyladenine glycosylase
MERRCTAIPLCEKLPHGLVLPDEFFARPSDEVGPDLIGKILWARGIGGGRLTEVEAYLPEGDAASHAAVGLTGRNAAMFGPPGSIYLFRSYGIHLLLNVVCDGVSVGSAVLIRSFEPLGETSCLRDNRVARRRRREDAPSAGSTAATDERQLSCGPGRVGEALGLHPGMNGLHLGDVSGLYILDDGRRSQVRCTTRIGISRGKSLPLRYYMAESRYVSELGRISRGDTA